MKQSALQTCSVCRHTVPVTSRFCPHCGASMTRPGEPEEIVIAGGNRLRVSQDTLNLRALLSIVESSVAWWQRQLHTSETVNRERAATAIKELSQILDSLAAQLAQGRETMRITTRLPTTRIYTVACPMCGHGNSATARFCRACGSLMTELAATAQRPVEPDVPRLLTAACTDLGQVRELNEDTCYAGELTAVGDVPAVLLLVADGMGGTQAGEVASRIASETVRQTLRQQLEQQQPVDETAWHTLLREAVQQANHQVYTYSQMDSRYARMGTTLTLLIVVGKHLHLAHVGDSRAYLLNERGVTEDKAPLMQMTSDHSLVARLVDIGQLTPDEARVHPQRNVIYRALGTNPAVEVDTMSQPLDVGDVLLLCSDGLNAHVDDAELARIVLADRQAEQVCQHLIRQANQLGGHDNISVVIAMVEG